MWHPKPLKLWIWHCALLSRYLQSAEQEFTINKADNFYEGVFVLEKKKMNYYNVKNSYADPDQKS